ncbi:type I restriction-modification system, restriction subunit R [Pseudoalteromonas distincta]|uniref:type I restriction endonuclease n=1 Tax=Pseudoalteromonas distincta TaxID=77608 RepID=UPI00020A0A59|nr:type I restriction endonuclease [Pseudoalteromonas distincta]EGI72769.1 type I restriction-modification system, restriction subunit R [Pseudoalteromonas distincta]
MSKVANFKEEFSSKIPAMMLLSKFGYEFISPNECEQLRGNKVASEGKTTSQVILLPVMRKFLANQTYMFVGKPQKLTEAAIDKIIHQLSPAMNEGLKSANEKLYEAMLYGVGVTEFIDGKKTSPTIQLIDWQNLDSNYFHFTEEMTVQNTEGTGNRRPDIVCFVNGLPLVVIEAKRPDSKYEGKSTCSEAISQHIRNQGQQEVPHLYAYSQLLLSINGHEGLYGTCGTPEKFWAKWKEEEIIEAEFVRLKNNELEKSKYDKLFAHRNPAEKDEYLTLLASGELTVTDQDRLVISLLKPDRLLEMVRLFTLFDKKVGKIVARYQQVFGIKALIERISNYDETGAREGGGNLAYHRQWQVIHYGVFVKSTNLVTRFSQMPSDYCY